MEIKNVIAIYLSTNNSISMILNGAVTITVFEVYFEYLGLLLYTNSSVWVACFFINITRNKTLIIHKEHMYTRISLFRSYLSSDLQKVYYSTTYY